jgi:DNA-binding CsgD family transcriptional regulator
VRQAQPILERALAAGGAPTPASVLARTELTAVLRMRGDYLAARPLGEQALAQAQRIGDLPLILRATGALNIVLQCLGDGATAVAMERETLRGSRAHGTPQVVVKSLSGLAWNLIVGGDLDGAELALHEPLLRAANEDAYAGPTLHTAGTLALQRAQFGQASIYFRMALSLTSEDGENTVFNAEGLAVVAARTDEPERALRLLAGAEALRQASGLVADPWWRRLLADTEVLAASLLARSESTAAVADGAALTERQLTRYALTDELPRKRRGGDARLTTREREIATLAADGLTNPQIAARLDVAVRTVGNHLANIREKLDLPTRAHLVTWVVNHQPAGQDH